MNFSRLDDPEWPPHRHRSILYSPVYKFAGFVISDLGFTRSEDDRKDLTVATYGELTRGRAVKLATSIIVATVPHGQHSEWSRHAGSGISGVVG